MKKIDVSDILIDNAKCFNTIADLVTIRDAINREIKVSANAEPRLSLVQVRMLVNSKGDSNVRLHMIKTVRAELGLGLKEAKELVDEYRELLCGIRL